MGDPLTAAAAVGSLASVGLKAYGQIEAGKGEQAAAEFKKQELEQAAKYGELEAKQRHGADLYNLSTKLGLFDAGRAAAGTDPTSPTGVALRSGIERLDFEGAAITQANARAQIEKQSREATFMGEAGEYAMGLSKIGAFATLAGGIGPSLGNPQFGFGKKAS